MKSAWHKRYRVDNNVNATHNLLAALVEADLLDTHVVHLATMGVYGYGTAAPALGGCPVAPAPPASHATPAPHRHHRPRSPHPRSTRLAQTLPSIRLREHSGLRRRCRRDRQRHTRSS